MLLAIPPSLRAEGGDSMGVDSGRSRVKTGIRAPACRTIDVLPVFCRTATAGPRRIARPPEAARAVDMTLRLDDGWMCAARAHDGPLRRSYSFLRIPPHFRGLSAQAAAATIASAIRRGVGAMDAFDPNGAEEWAAPFERAYERLVEAIMRRDPSGGRKPAPGDRRDARARPHRLRAVRRPGTTRLRSSRR